MRHDFSPAMLRKWVGQLPDLDLARVRYCYQIGSTFVASALLEDAVINAMLMCERIRVEKVLGTDAPYWQRLIDKQQLLQESTLGSLIGILNKHGLMDADLAYLRWIKTKRDFFIHRFFHSGAWPGDLDEDLVDRVCRTLGALEIVFHRGAGRIIPILGRCGLLQVQRVGDGYLASNIDLSLD